MSRGTFDIVRSNAAQPWHLRIATTRILAASETYARKVGATRAATSIVRMVLGAAAGVLEEYAWRNDVISVDAFTEAARVLRSAGVAEQTSAALVVQVDER